jgi:hypothetical protein
MCSATNTYGAFEGASFKASYIRDLRGGYRVTINDVTKPGILGKIGGENPFCVKQHGSPLKYCWKDEFTR